MQWGVWFYAICGLWAMAVVFALIRAARLTYRVEARSGRPFLRNGLPGYANIVPVAFNIGVARDAETQALRRQVVVRLLLILCGFAALWLFIVLAGAEA